MNLSDIKILIIENSEDDLNNIKNALLDYENKIGSKFYNENLKEYLVQPKKIDDSDIEVHVDPVEIYEKTKKIINRDDIDILFIDLNLGKSTQQGIQLIRQYMNDPQLASIPKYVITTETNFLEEKDETGAFKNTDIQHFTTILNKPTPNQLDAYITRFEEDQLFEGLPIVARAYNKQKKVNDLEYVIQQFEMKAMHLLSENQNSIDEIVKNIFKLLDSTRKLGDKIEGLDQRTIAIEIMTKSIVKALPKISNKDKAKKLMRDWEENDELKNVMAEGFPELPKGLYNILKEGAENILDNAATDISQVLYDAGKEYIQQGAGIEDDDSKVIALMKYSSYFVEKVWEAKKTII